MTDPDPFNVELRHARLQAGMTQFRLGEASGTSMESISDWERAERVPRPGNAEKLAIALNHPALLDSYRWSQENQWLYKWPKKQMLDASLRQLQSSELRAGQIAAKQALQETRLEDLRREYATRGAVKRLAKLWDVTIAAVHLYRVEMRDLGLFDVRRYQTWDPDSGICPRGHVGEIHLRKDHGVQCNACKREDRSNKTGCLTRGARKKWISDTICPEGHGGEVSHSADGRRRCRACIRVKKGYSADTPEPTQVWDVKSGVCPQGHVGEIHHYKGAGPRCNACRREKWAASPPSRSCRAPLLASFATSRSYEREPGMTDLIPQPNLERAVATGAISFGDLMDALAETNAEGESRTAAPAAPVKISISDDQRILLRRLAVQLAEVRLPDGVRELTEAEKAEFVAIFTDVKSGKDAIASAETALKEVFANHLDVEARAQATGELPTDKHGHVLKAGEVVADGVSTKVTRELRGGKADPLSLADLKRLEDTGAIDHNTFLQMTTSVPATRRIDEGKIMDLLARKPELVHVLASVATLSDKTASYYVRKNK